MNLSGLSITKCHLLSNFLVHLDTGKVTFVDLERFFATRTEERFSLRISSRILPSTSIRPLLVKRKASHCPRKKTLLSAREAWGEVPQVDSTFILDALFDTSGTMETACESGERVARTIKDRHLD